MGMFEDEIEMLKLLSLPMPPLSVVHTALTQAMPTSLLQVSLLPIHSWLKLIIMNYLTLPAAVLIEGDEFSNIKLKLTTFSHCRQLNGLVNELILNCFRCLTV